MSCPADCTTTQIIEPNSDLLVDVAGSTSDLDERGELVLTQGQTSAGITFQVPKLNANLNFEYLYIEAPGVTSPGSITVVPTLLSIEGFVVVFAGTPIQDGYVLKWRVTVVTTVTLVQVDAPESLYLRMPMASTMSVAFVNPRSGVNYGFTELRVENLTDPPDIQAVISVQVYQKTMSGFLIAINPRPPTNNYFIAVRTP